MNLAIYSNLKYEFVILAKARISSYTREIAAFAAMTKNWKYLIIILNYYIYISSDANLAACSSVIKASTISSKADPFITSPILYKVRLIR